MMDPATHTALLRIAAMLLGGASVAGVFALRLQSQRQRFRDRVAFVTGGHAVAADEVTRNARRQVERTTPWLQQAALIFGYNTKRSAHYKVKWWVVLPTSLLLAWLGAQLVLPLLGAIALVGAPVMGVMLSRTFYKICNDRRRQALYLQFPDALAMIVRGVRVGIPVRESMSAVARECPEPTAGEFRVVAERVSLGAPVEDALYEMAERNDVAEYRFFATAIGLQAQTGGALSETLENLADVIRKRLALRARGYALASEARASIAILCALPVITGLALSAINPHYIAQLFNNDTGRKVFGCAVLSFAIGLTVMRQIVKKTLS